MVCIPAAHKRRRRDGEREAFESLSRGYEALCLSSWNSFRGLTGLGTRAHVCASKRSHSWFCSPAYPGPSILTFSRRGDFLRRVPPRNSPRTNTGYNRCLSGLSSAPRTVYAHDLTAARISSRSSFFTSLSFSSSSFFTFSFFLAARLVPNNTPLSRRHRPRLRNFLRHRVPPLFNTPWYEYSGCARSLECVRSVPMRLFLP